MGAEADPRDGARLLVHSVGLMESISVWDLAASVWAMDAPTRLTNVETKSARRELRMNEFGMSSSICGNAVLDFGVPGNIAGELGFI